MGTEERKRMFAVTVRKKEVVAAVLPTQEQWLPLSNLDLLLPPVDVGVFFCYRNHMMIKFETMVGVLKKALAQVLVCYYAFAGEVAAVCGEPHILCNNRGVDFLEAFADIELKELNLYNPDHAIEGKLVPEKNDGVLAIQVTKLKCGGIVVACTFDHRIADAYSANMFLVSWAETAKYKDLPEMFPSFRRSLLNPRRPVCVDPSLDDMYVPISELQRNPDIDHDDNLISRIYYVKSDQLNHLQTLASSNNNNNNNIRCSKLESFCAFLWQLVAKSSNTGITLPHNKNNNNDKKQKKIFSKMGIVVDGRSRLSNNDDKIMNSYFGNVLSIPYGGNTIADLIQNPLSWVANQVHNFLQTAVTKDHFLGLIDWVEAQKPEPALAKIYASGNDDGPAFVVSSGQRFPVSKVDFGWGIPFLGSYHFPWKGSSGYVMPMPSPTENGDWIVYMHLSKAQIEFIEAEAATFFKPLTSDYLYNLCTS